MMGIDGDARAELIRRLHREARSERAKVVSGLRRAWTRYWTRRAARATFGILSRLDDRTLKDIGLDRSEIERIANGDCRHAGACGT